ncbi:MAG: hypothetical protein ABSA85_17420 [Terracidiphilus sp.]|jgi:hypothetical protein
MGFLPKFHQFIKMGVGDFHNVSHLISLRITGLDGIPSHGQSCNSILAQFQNGDNSLILSVDMRRSMVFRVNAEGNSIKFDRNPRGNDTPSVSPAFTPP